MQWRNQGLVADLRDLRKQLREALAERDHHRETLRRVALRAALLKGVECLGHAEIDQVLRDREPQLFEETKQ